MAKKKKQVAFDNFGKTTALGSDGNPIESLQVSWPQLWKDHAVSLGYNLSDFLIEMPNQVSLFSSQQRQARAMFMGSGQTGVFDKAGKQVAELQEPWVLLWAKHAEAHGYDPTEFQVTLPIGKAGIVRNYDGSFNWVPF